MFHSGWGFGRKPSFDGFLSNIHEVRWAQDVPPPTDPWKWGDAIGAWMLSAAQVDALNPKLQKILDPKSETLNPKL